MPTGWPTDAELAAKLGRAVDANVTSANEAAAADATRYGTPSGVVDATGALDAATFETILALGVAWFNDRNRGPEYGVSPEYATNPRVDRLQALDRLQAARRPLA
jgi:hypothetical protein